MKINNYNAELLSFLKSVGIAHPKNLSIYKEALTHKSYGHGWGSSLFDLFVVSTDFECASQIFM